MSGAPYRYDIFLRGLQRAHLFRLRDVREGTTVGIQHRGHTIIHLSKIYQENKNKILNELAKFDNKIEVFRKNGSVIKQDLQRLHVQLSQKKNFIEEYFVGLIERLEEEHREHKDRIEGKYDENLQEIEFLENFRDNICQEMECRSEKELVAKSEEFIKYIRSLCDREVEADM
jgi:hypothetical protein